MACRRTNELVSWLTTICIARVALGYVLGCLDLRTSYDLGWNNLVTVKYLHLACLCCHTSSSLVGLLLNHALSYVGVVVFKSLSWTCMRDLRCVRYLVGVGVVKILDGGGSSIWVGLLLIEATCLEGVLLCWLRMSTVAVAAVHQRLLLNLVIAKLRQNRLSNQLEVLCNLSTLNVIWHWLFLELSSSLGVCRLIHWVRLHHLCQAAYELHGVRRYLRGLSWVNFFLGLPIPW